MKWSAWKPMPSKETCRQIEGPDGPGVYQLKNKATNELILFGIGKRCRKRMKSLFPAPYGTGKRNNAEKRKYVLENWQNLVYRTIQTETRAIAKSEEDKIKLGIRHVFHT